MMFDQRNFFQKLRGAYFGRGSLFYGHYYILRDYTNINLPFRIPGIIQHGWMYDCGIHGYWNYNKKQKGTIII